MTDISAYEPRAFRIGIIQSAVLVRADGAESAVTITNVSQSGFCMKAADQLGAGERVILRGEAGDVPAEVRWTRGHDAGGVFLPPDQR
jgi:hypothetical protein